MQDVFLISEAPIKWHSLASLIEGADDILYRDDGGIEVYFLGELNVVMPSDHIIEYYEEEELNCIYDSIPEPKIYYVGHQSKDSLKRFLESIQPYLLLTILVDNDAGTIVPLNDYIESMK